MRFRLKIYVKDIPGAMLDWLELGEDYGNNRGIDFFCVYKNSLKKLKLFSKHDIMFRFEIDFEVSKKFNFSYLLRGLVFIEFAYLFVYQQ